MRKVKKLSELASDQIKIKMYSVEHEMNIRKQNNKKIKENEIEEIKTLKKKVQCLNEQIKMERRQQSNQLAREKMLRAFLNEKIHRLKNKVERDGVTELQNIVYGINM
jgi:hypothetical protein